MLRTMIGILLSFWIANVLSQHTDTIAKINASGTVKRYSYGGTPILAFDPDLGLRYGIVINIFDHGKKPTYPDYKQYLKIKLFNSTKGTSNISLLLDSYSILPKTSITMEFSAIKDTKLDFWGFNGKNAIYHPEYINSNDYRYKNQFYYSHQRSIFRYRINLQREIKNSHWLSLLGFSYQQFMIENPDFNKLNPANQLDGTKAENISLYNEYIDFGIIKPDEASGGRQLNVLTGIVYDTRNNKITCKRGVWFETYFLTSFNQNKAYSYLTHIANFRTYYHFRNTHTTIAYRLSSQQKLAGHIPFYALPAYYNTRQDQDGPGGAFTLRGIYRNRFASNGYLLSNLIVRKRIASFSLLKIRWMFEASLFSDAVVVTQQHKFETNNIPKDYFDANFNIGKQNIQYTLGGGLHIIYNENNIISMNYGYSPDKQLGDTGLYIGSSFLF